MSFLNLAAVGFAALLPLIVLLYLLKLRRQERVVSSTYLWKRAIEDFRVNAPFQKLRRNLLLLLQLLFLALLVFSLMRPFIEGCPSSGESLFVLIDNSASMQATDVAPSRLDEAKRLAREAVDRMGDDDNMMVIAFSSKATIVASLTGDRMRLKQAIDDLRPADTRTNLREAILIAASVAAPPQATTNPARPAPAPAAVASLAGEAHARRRIVILSDGRFTDLPDHLPENLPVTLVPVGSATARNLAITALDARRALDAPGDYQVFVRVENSGRLEESASLELHLNDALIDAAPVTVAPGKSVARVFEKHGLEKGTLKVCLDQKDHLAVDDAAWTIIGAESSIDILLVTSGNRFLEKALMLDPRTRVSRLDPESFARDEAGALEGKETHDFVVFDRCAPKRLPPGRYLFVGVVPPVPGLVAGGSVENPIIVDWHRSHAVTRFLDFGNVDIGKASPLTLPSGAATLLDSDRGALIGAVEKEGLQVVVVGFDLFESNWPLRLSFPLFISNVVEWLGGAGTRLTVGTRAPGEGVTIYPDRGADRMTVVDPAGERQEFKVGEQRAIPYAATQRVGIYRVEWTRKVAGADEKHELRFAVNLLNGEESNLVPRADVKLGDESVATARVVGSTNREIWRWFALAAFVLLLLEWAVYHLRVGV